MRRLADRGLGVVLISHNLNDVFQVADDIAVLYLGQMVAQVRSDEVTHGQVVELITTGSSGAHGNANGSTNGTNGHVNGTNGTASEVHVGANGKANGRANGHANGKANGRANGHANGKANGRAAKEHVTSS